SKEAAKIAVGTNGVKARGKGKVVTIARKKVTSLMIVQSPRRTRLLSKDLGVIVKMVMNHKKMQHVSWPSTLKRYNPNHLFEIMI
nr:hypothetical protein [Tanacetum cinerariifolium]